MHTINHIGVYPGTFDPITSGHMDIIKRSMPLVDHLIIDVTDNISKIQLFSREERVLMVQSAIGELASQEASVQVESFDGLLVDFARRHNSRMIIRGLRAVSDFEYEFKMAAMNERLAPE